MAKDNDIVNTKIILYPQCYINVDYIPHFISGAYILQEVPTIFFDKDIIKENMAKIEEKYHIEKIQPVDMFPFTSHVECVAVLQLKQNM